MGKRRLTVPVDSRKFRTKRQGSGAYLGKEKQAVGERGVKRLENTRNLVDEKSGARRRASSERRGFNRTRERHTKSFQIERYTSVKNGRHRNEFHGGEEDQDEAKVGEKQGDEEERRGGYSTIGSTETGQAASLTGWSSQLSYGARHQRGARRVLQSSQLDVVGTNPIRRASASNSLDSGVPRMIRSALPPDGDNEDGRLGGYDRHKRHADLTY
ncbi:hypothetical protein Q1695_010535 [Nippostrongylus brasiliensis]|nr:hypothetical protein Q1695_010535 [Nippostrongylus brasiliensis]